MPEFEIKYNTQHDDTIAVPLVKPLEIEDVDEMANLELQSLVTRWMPKQVFILVSSKKKRNHINVNICELYYFYKILIYIFFCFSRCYVRSINILVM